AERPSSSCPSSVTSGSDDVAWEPPAVGARATWTRTITADDVQAFARISGDRNPLHFDVAFAERTKLGGLIVHGVLTTALFNALVAEVLPAPGRWRQLTIISGGVLLAFAPWFSASAVGPLLERAWQPTGLDLPLLTVAVQLGFAAAAIVLALSGAADVIDGPRLFVGGAIVAAIGNLGFAALTADPASALPWRALTGAGLAAVYPVAVKMLAGWFRR